jgi:hypothetical protein
LRRAIAAVNDSEAPGAASPPSILVRPTGNEVILFRRSSDACDPDDVPDAPARALRVADGSVAVFAANQQNRVLRGVDLLSVRPDCAVVFAESWAADPAQYDDRLWLASTWSADSTNVIALVHSEYQGNRHPGQCPSGRYTASRRSATALIRTEHPDAPASWRAWDGTAFGVEFIDPYRSTAPPVEHVCPTVDRNHLAGPVASLVRHAPSGAYVVLFVAGNPAGDAQLPWAVFSAESWDLVHWSLPRLVIPVARFDAIACWTSVPLAYPSLIDPGSPSVNFDTVGDSAQLFLTRFNLDGCRTSLDRDLIRMPVSLTIDPS